MFVSTLLSLRIPADSSKLLSRTEQGKRGRRSPELQVHNQQSDQANASSSEEGAVMEQFLFLLPDKVPRASGPETLFHGTTDAIIKRLRKV